MKRVLTAAATAICLLSVLCGNAAEWTEGAWTYFEANVMPNLLTGGFAFVCTAIMTLLQKRYVNKGMAQVYLSQKEYGRQTAELSELKKEYAGMADRFEEMKAEYGKMLSELTETTRLVRGAIAGSVKLVQSGEAKRILNGEEEDGGNA